MANIYNDPQQPSAFGSMLMMGAFIGVDVAYGKATGLVSEGIAATTLGKRRHFGLGRTAEAFDPRSRVRTMALLKENKQRYDQMSFIGRARVRRKLAGQFSSKAWSGFFSGTGWAGRMEAAGKALEGLPGVVAGKAPVWRALAAGPLSFLSSYMIWGSMIPGAVDLGLGIFNEAAAEGRRLRGGTPETVSKQYDMATKQQAFTMRQASMMAMHMSQTGVRAAIGNEASFLH